MAIKKEYQESFAELRRKAEELLERGLGREAVDELDDIETLLNELQVYQTELEIQNKELLESYERYADLYNNAPIGFITTTPEGIISECNSSVCEMLGTDRKNILKKPLSKFIDTEDSEFYYLELKKLFRQKAPCACEIRLKRKDGRSVCALLEGKAAKASRSGEEEFRISLKDISSYKKVENALKELSETGKNRQELAYREKLLEAAASATAMLLSIEDSEISVNGALEILGESVQADRVYIFENHSDSESGEKLMSHVCEWDKSGILTRKKDRPQNIPYEPAFTRWRKLFSEKKPLNGLVREFPECEKSALSLHNIVSLLAVPISVEDRTWGFIGFDDCSRERIWTESEISILSTVGSAIGSAIERKRTEKQLEKYTSKLQEVNKELSEYTNAVSHDLKTPLRAVHNYTDFLMEDLHGKLKDEQKTYLEGISHAIKEAEQLVENLLELSRLGSHEAVIEKVDMKTFMKDLLVFMNLPDDVRVEMDGEWPRIDTERTFLRQIFINLISNAVKFNKSRQKKISFGSRLVGEEQKYFHEFYVKDNGIGIDPKYKDRVFGIFERLHTNDEYEGTGIGLAIVARLLKKLSGSIRLESGPGKGSTFFIRLPAKPPEDRTYS